MYIIIFVASFEITSKLVYIFVKITILHSTLWFIDNIIYTNILHVYCINLSLDTVIYQIFIRFYSLQDIYNIYIYIHVYMSQCRLEFGTKQVYIR